MADGTAATSAFESHGDLYDFNGTQQKDWFPFDMDMSRVGSDSLYIHPNRLAAENNHPMYSEHPEAVDDDDEEDDDMYDYDLPVGASSITVAGFNLPGIGQPMFPPSSSFTYFTDHGIQNTTPSVVPMDPLYSARYTPPVHTVDPHDLQLSHDPKPVLNDDVLRFEPAIPIAYEHSDTSTRHDLSDDMSPDCSPFTLDMDMDIDSSLSRPQQLDPIIDHEPPFSTATPPTSALAIPIPAPAPALTTPSPAPCAPAPPPEPSLVSVARVHTPVAKRKKMAHGPHRCDMTLPNGGPCNKAFTRPYDLARHQETIHAQVRKMYTCPECGDSSKTFSRMDALSRHIRIKHPKRD